METITRQQVLRQFRKDLIGKDSHRGVTLTYSWLANQFGHFSLGFIPTFIVFVMIETQGREQRAAFLSAFAVSAFWLVFELYNFLGPLYLKRSFRSMVRFRKKVVFAPAFRNIAFDTFTDLCFFWLGSLTASTIIAVTREKVIGLIILVAVLLWIGRTWYLTKIHLQAAQYPFQFRLSQWEKPISNENKAAIEAFRKKKDTGHHLFVFGPANAGKSSLCIGIATEVSIEQGKCLYTTAMKLFSLFFESPSETAVEDNFWSWRDASLLVIDDINAGHPVDPDVVLPRTFLQFLHNESFGDDNIRALKDKNVIWVLGNDDQDRRRQQTWKTLVRDIGVVDANITSIDLTYVKKTR